MNIFATPFMNFTNDIQDLVYQSYQEIEQHAYQERIRYFDNNKEAISSLPYDLRVELSLDYVSALYEVGDHNQYLRQVDPLLEVVIAENIYSVDGDDIYQELLFRKASSSYNILDYFNADHVFTALLKINPKNELYQACYKNNLITKWRFEAQKLRAIIISLFLLTGLIIAVELMVIRPFHENLVWAFESLRNVLFSIAFFGIIFQEISLRVRARRSLKNLLNQKKS